jgi:DNA-binding HxlR family transcriptional regulator
VNPIHPPNPLGTLASKWAIPLVMELSAGIRRFSELERAMPGISQKVLAQTLRRLEADGLVTRTVYPSVPPIVEYELTPLGCAALEPIERLRVWAEGRTDAANAA